ncbi:hypothetical protein [Streptomyces malaysiensis]|uniref:Secreted protein n=1 Tax=Streptomyces malaysiensis subsp. samsunensis TaxID=459658 RepID=A0A9X2LW42_STRMQ|nr:hypothetical protein [Streptomyces samsunensis]MCQ8830556.1 hypothetical protein [Streptomyces samsunensis]
MLKKYLATAIAGAGLLAAFPFSAAHAATPTSASSVQVPGCPHNWTVSSAEGVASGQWCYNKNLAIGTVTDTKADGRCPYVRGYTSYGRTVDSDWAGPKGDSSPVYLDAGTGDPFVRLAMKYVNC